MNTINTTDTMNTANTTTPADGTQELKSSWVQEPAALAANTAARKRVARPDDQGRAAADLTKGQARERLKSERVQLRLQGMQGWQMQKGGKAIDRVREFPDAYAAAAYMAFATMLARQAGLPLWARVEGRTIQVAVSGNARRAEGLTDAVLDLAEQLG